MKIAAALIAALGLIFLTATGLVKLWALWVKHREEHAKQRSSGPTFRESEDFYLASGLRSEAPEPMPAPAATIETEPSPPPQPAKPPIRRHRRANLLNLAQDLAQELGIRLR